MAREALERRLMVDHGRWLVPKFLNAEALLRGAAKFEESGDVLMRDCFMHRLGENVEVRPATLYDFYDASFGCAQSS